MDNFVFGQVGNLFPALNHVEVCLEESKVVTGSEIVCNVGLVCLLGVADVLG